MVLHGGWSSKIADLRLSVERRPDRPEAGTHNQTAKMLPDKTLEIRADPRPRLLRAVRRHFAQNRRPRLMMSGVLLLTGAAGLLTSFMLLRAGLIRMWLRYPAALFVAWAVFLVLVRAWAEYERRSFQFDEKALDASSVNDLPDAPDAPLPLSFPNRSWLKPLDALDIGDIGDLGEGCLPVLGGILLIVVTVITFGAIINIVAAAPYLISEVFLDAVLVAALYQRMRRLDRRSWLQSAVRHTLVPTLWTALLLFGFGVLFHILAPEAKSIRGVWHHFVHGRPPAEVEVEAPSQPGR